MVIKQLFRRIDRKFLPGVVLASRARLLGLLFLKQRAELMGQVLILALRLHQGQLRLGQLELELADALVGRLQLAVAGFRGLVARKLQLLLLLESGRN